MKLKNTLIVFITILFTACSGGGSKKDEQTPPKKDNYPIIQEKSNNLTINKINKNNVIVSFKKEKKEFFFEYYNLIVKKLNDNESLKISRNYNGNIDLDNDCVKVSTDTKECKVEFKNNIKNYIFSIKGLSSGSKYSIDLELCDKNDKCLSYDKVNIQNNIPPKANAGIDKNLNVNEKFVLDGSISYDKDGQITKYEWYDGNNFLGEGKIITSTLSVIGKHVITLFITDNDGLKDSDFLIINVLSLIGNNILPKAKVLEDIEKKEKEIVVLDGSKSSDEDGEIVRYEWYEGTKLLSEEKIFSKNDFEVGTHTITLKVTDDKGAIDSVNMNVIIKDTTSPIITNIIPSHNTNNVNLDSSFIISFNEAIFLPNKSDIKLKDNLNNQFDLSKSTFILSADMKNLYIKLDKKLKENTKYTLTFSPNIKDLAGNTLTENKNISFSTLELESSIIEFNLISWDDSTEEVKFSVFIENDEGELELENIILNKNGKKQYSKKVKKDKKYKVEMKNKFNTCTSNYNFGQLNISNGEKININIDCKVKVKLLPSIKDIQTLTFVKDDTLKIWSTQIQKISDNSTINSDKLVYSSSDEKIATINEKGIITFKSIGDVQFNVKINSLYYESENVITYHLSLIEGDDKITIQDIQMGQNTIVSLTKPTYTRKYRQAGFINYNLKFANHKESIIRAYIYGNKEQILNPTTNITFTKKDGTIFKKNMTCPKFLHYGEIKDEDGVGYNYNIKDTCYAIMETEEEKSFIDEGVSIKIKVGSLTKTANPDIMPRKYLNIYLVKGKNKKGEAYVSNEDLEEIKERLLDVFPVSQVNVRVREELYPLDPIIGQALKELERIHSSETKFNEIVYGLVPGRSGGGIDDDGLAAGMAGLYKNFAVGRDKASDYEGYKKIMSHEIGHNFGLNHAPCGLGISGVDKNFWENVNWKYTTFRNGEKGWFSHHGFLSDSPVYIAKTNEVVNPWVSQNTGDDIVDNRIQGLIGQATDLMGYCGGYRFAKTTYDHIQRILMQGESRFDSPVINVNSRGVRSSNSFKVNNAKYKMIINAKEVLNKIVLEPIDVTSNNIKNTFFVNPSSYQVLIETENEKVKYPLEIITLDHSNEKKLNLVIPYIKEIKNLKFYKDGKEIKYIVKGISEISKIRNNQADIIYKNNVISWNTSFKFMSVVFISKNGKRNLLAHGVKGGVYNISNSLNNGKLEVIVSNGINSVIKNFIVN